jgi:hypothetical protein
MQDAARNLVEDEAYVTEIDRMAGICAALVPNDPVRTLGKHVDELALPLVSPLRSNDDDRALALREHGTGIRAKKYAPAGFPGALI